MHKRDLSINHNRVIEFSKYSEYVVHTTILIQMLDIELYSSPTCKPKRKATHCGFIFIFHCSFINAKQDVNSPSEE